MSIIPALKWRYSLKHFSNKSVSDQHIDNLVEAARFSASSYGLQPYTLLVISDRDLLQQLSKEAFDQAQVRECSHLLVFLPLQTLSEQNIDQHFDRVYEQSQTPKGSLNGYADHIKRALLNKTADELKAWAEQQAYIALGSVLAEAASLGIDTCPMTGFDPVAFNRTLQLEGSNQGACVICAVGYRQDSDIPPIKVRIPKEHFSAYL